ncbi:trypco2 family protein [Kitasatospora sp. NPDC001225]
MEIRSTELSEAIKAVRTGLVEAQQDGDGLPIRFSVREITLDLEVELRHSVSAGGGVKAFVVSADAKGERASTRSHRLTVTLDIQSGQAGGDVLIGDQRALTPLPGPAAN